MKGFVQDIEGLAVKNKEFRRVLYTAKHCQLVVMALKPKGSSEPSIQSAVAPNPAEHMDVAMADEGSCKPNF